MRYAYEQDQEGTPLSLGFARPEPPEFEYTEKIANLREDPKFLDGVETLINLSATNPVWFDAGAMDNEDPIEFIRDLKYRMTSAAANAMRLPEASEKEKEAYKYVMDRFDRAELAPSDYLTAIKDITIDTVVDPTTLIGLASRAAMGTKAALDLSQRNALVRTMRNVAVGENTKEEAIRGAIAGGGYEGTLDFFTQEADVETGRQDEFSLGQNVGMTALGAGLGFAAGKIFGRKVADETRIPSKQIVDSDPETSKASVDFANKAYTILGDGTIDLDGSQFRTIDDAVEALAESVGGGEKTKGELKEIVRQTIKENQGSTGRVVASKLGFKAGQYLHGMIPKVTLVGKPAGILSAYAPFSKTAAMLQKRFRYDLGRSIKGERVLEDPDFFETFKYTSSPRLTKVKFGLDSLRGVMTKEEANSALTTALRGGEVAPEVEDVFNIIRNNLDEIADDLVGYNIIDRPVKNYFPRMWDRNAIENNQEKFIDLLIEDGAVYDRAEGMKLTSELLNIENQIDSGRRGASFFSKRTLNISDDNVFSEFLDNDISAVLNGYITQTSKSIAKAKVFGVQNESEFIKLWIGDLNKGGIAGEMAEAGRALTGSEKDEIINIYRSITGEGITKFNTVGQGILDGYTVANRVALLPLATLSSLSEIGLNIVKAGTTTSLKSFAQAADIGFKTISTKVKQKLTKDFDLTEPEIWREMNEVGLALDQAVAEGAERLSGEAIANDTFRYINNKFFRLNLLDQWTKTVQMTSYITGKNLIKKNLEKISVRGRENAGLEADQLTELGIDVDEGLAWLNGGADLSDSFYTKNIARGAARYTNEVILNPTPEAGIKPAFMSDPKTSVLFQLLGYPAAFTNVVLKKMATDTFRDPVGNLPKVTAGALIMTHVAMFSNYVRTHGEGMEDKSWDEIYGEAVARWGGGGLTLDAANRAVKAVEVFQSPTAYFTAPFGPIVGDVHNAVATRRLASVLGQKVPGYTAMRFFGLEEQQEEYDQLLRDIDKVFVDVAVPERKKKTTGGIVDVPNAPEEPDERVDKLTGLPYNRQAGAAFMDEDDPLKRMGFAKGSLILQGLDKVIETFSPAKPTFEQAKTATNELLLEGVEEADSERVKAILEGVPFAVPQPELDDVIEEVLVRNNLVQSPEDAFIESQAQAQATIRTSKERARTGDDDFTVDPNEQFMILKNEIETLRRKSDQESKDTVSIIDLLKYDVPKTAASSSFTGSEVNRSKNLREFLRGSVVRDPVYRATGHGLNTAFEINFALPKEISAHFGTKKQADVLTLREYYESGGAELDRSLENMEITDLYDRLTVRPGMTPAMTKGYLNIKKPLILEDLGNFDAVDIINSRSFKDDFLPAVAAQSGKSLNKVMELYNGFQINRLVNNYLDFNSKYFDDSERPNHQFELLVRQYNINKRFKKFLKAVGFDGIKYKNKHEATPDQIGDKDFDFSYIPFEPEQFKVVGASKFDPEDPRAAMYNGGQADPLRRLGFGGYA